jgi:hypothetical protein
MAEGKWISDLKATTPLDDAARRVLTVHLRSLATTPKALRPGRQDVDTFINSAWRRARRRRRASSPVPLRKVCKNAAGCEVRRAAGGHATGTCFCSASTIGHQASAVVASGPGFLIGYGVARRRGGAPGRGRRGLPFFFDRLLADTLAAVTKPRSPGLPADATLVDLARPMLGELLRELHDAASGDLDDYEHLHQVRILGKRLRYAMEVFADCFAPPFREELYPAVEQMQEILGNANDSHVAAGRLVALREKLRVMRPAD